MTIPAAFLDELRVRTSLSALIGRSVKVTRAGREWKACCPFHNEKTPSFTINDEKGFYHCFGCGAHGDAIRWMTDQRGLTFIDAVRELAAAAGLDMPAQDPRAAERGRAHDAMRDIMERACRFYAEQLKQMPAVRDLLGRRGIDTAQIESFGIGYAPASSRGQPPALVQHLRDVTPDRLIALGLAKRSERDTSVYDFFRHRIMIPIRDPRGRVIAFGARAIADASTGETRGPKYLNSPDSPLFDKGRSLFNLDRASAPARQNGRLVVVEGYLDVLALDRAGVAEAVAPNGTAFTVDQLRLIWARAATPILCFDGDDAGQKAALRAARLALPLIEPGRTLSFAMLPAGLDPDDLQQQQGAAAVSQLLASPLPLVDILWRALINSAGDLSNPDARAALRADMDEVIGRIEHPQLRAEYALSFRERFHTAGTRARSTRRQSSASRMSDALPDAIEAAIVHGLILDPSLVREQFERIAIIQWRSDACARLIDTLIDLSLDDAMLDSASVWTAIERGGLGEEARRMMQSGALRFGFLKAPGTMAARDELSSALYQMPLKQKAKA